MHRDGRVQRGVLCCARAVRHGVQRCGRCARAHPGPCTGGRRRRSRGVWVVARREAVRGLRRRAGQERRPGASAGTCGRVGRGGRWQRLRTLELRRRLRRDRRSRCGCRPLWRRLARDPHWLGWQARVPRRRCAAPTRRRNRRSILPRRLHHRRLPRAPAPVAAPTRGVAPPRTAAAPRVTRRDQARCATRLGAPARARETRLVRDARARTRTRARRAAERRRTTCDAAAAPGSGDGRVGRGRADDVPAGRDDRALGEPHEVSRPRTAIAPCGARAG